MSTETLSPLTPYELLPVFPSAEIKRELAVDTVVPHEFFDRIMSETSLTVRDDYVDIVDRNANFALMGDAVWNIAVMEWTQKLGHDYQSPWFQQIIKSFQKG